MGPCSSRTCGLASAGGKHVDLSLFRSPDTGRALDFDRDALVADGERFPLVRGIPRFVGMDNYAEAFGLQWNTFKLTQFDSHTGRPITEERLRAALDIPLESLRGKRVLEAGSGAGRFTEILLKHGALVWSFDYSSAVDANAANNLPNENLTLFQADIRRIPFNDETFDVVICLGVLQHTPSTKQSLAELARVLRPGGLLATDHYKWHLGAFTSLYLPWWMIIKRFRPDRQLRVTDKLTEIFFPIHWTVRDLPWAQVLLRRVSPINFYHGRFDLTREHHYEWSRLDTHDRNTDHYKRHVTRSGYMKMLRNLGFPAPEVEIGGTGYVGRARKAPAS
jgi:SAM-dependent methyltransferase